jgi:hypothetical protein
VQLASLHSFRPALADLLLSLLILTVSNILESHLARFVGSDDSGKFSTSWVHHQDVDPMLAVTRITLNAFRKTLGMARGGAARTGAALTLSP